jgi:hypothetical protein
MKIAIYNPHMAPNIANMGIHNYIINLIRDGHTPYIFIDQIDKNYTKTVIKRLISHLPIQLFDTPIHLNGAEKIPWLESKLIFSRKRLNSECDVLISFNTHHKERSVSRAVKAFPGLKIWHVGDYFWNEAGSIINKRLLDNGISHVMGYSSHDKHCEYFQKTFPAFEGKVISVAFGYTKRFENSINFDDRKNKSVGLGSVNPLRPLDHDICNFRESADFYPDESWFHRGRRKLILNKKILSHTMDFMLPEFPKIKDFKYDLVEKFNEYKMFTSCESIFYFPSAKIYEGSACGTVNICIEHDCNREFGFKDGVNCIMYEEGNVDSYIQQVEYYQNNQDKLKRISVNAQKHVHDNFRHEMVAQNIIKSIKDVYQNNV